MAILVWTCKIVLVSTFVVMVIYLIRHYIFSLVRLFSWQRTYFLELTGSYLPNVTVIIPMHNEEKVAELILNAMVMMDYPREKFEVIAVNDRSTDRTGEIIDEYSRRFSFIKAYHRQNNFKNNLRTGKQIVLQEVMDIASGDILIVFDADYFPGRGLLKQLVAPFVDPEVGAVMGRVVPHNTGTNFLTRMLDLERSGGYQVDQQARFILNLIPQYGGTVGGVRREVVKLLGGWDENILAEDTEITFRLAINGWKVAYVNWAECYEEVPNTWQVRLKQVSRWAIGHTQCFFKYLTKMFESKRLKLIEKVDMFLLAFIYLTSPVLLLGWVASLILFFTGYPIITTLFIFTLSIMSYNTTGNFACFFQLGIASFLDGRTEAVKIMPLGIFNFLVYNVNISIAVFKLIYNTLSGKDIKWVKTKRV